MWKVPIKKVKLCLNYFEWLCLNNIFKCNSRNQHYYCLFSIAISKHSLEQRFQRWCILHRQKVKAIFLWDKKCSHISLRFTKRVFVLCGKPSFWNCIFKKMLSCIRVQKNRVNRKDCKTLSERFPSKSCTFSETKMLSWKCFFLLHKAKKLKRRASGVAEQPEEIAEEWKKWAGVSQTSFDFWREAENCNLRILLHSNWNNRINQFKPFVFKLKNIEFQNLYWYV